MQQKGIFTTFAKSISVKSRKKHKLLSKCKKSADNAIYLNEQNSYN